MKITTTSLLILGLLPLISAQPTYYDNRYPPAPATRRVIMRNGQLISRQNAAIQQAPIDDELDEPEPQLQQVPQEPQDLEEPIILVQEEVPTQRPLRNGNGFSQQPVTSLNGNTFSRPTNGRGFSRIPQQPIYEGVGQTVDRDDEGSNEQQQDISQQKDIGLTDTPQVDVSTEKLVPGIVTSSEEDTSDDGFTPTEPLQRPLVVKDDAQRPVNGNGQKPLNGNGRKTTNGSKQKKVNGNGQKPLDGDGQKPTYGDQQKPLNGDQQKPLNGDQQKPVEGDGKSATSGDHHSSGGDGHHDHHSGDPIQWLRDAIRGEPGVDYPIFFSPPETAFKCKDQQWPGYYADVEARCQVFHICQSNGRSDAFLCPNGTIFSQQNYVCVWWHDFDCSTATQFYELNAQLYVTPEAKVGQTGDATAGQTGDGTDEQARDGTVGQTRDGTDGQTRDGTDEQIRDGTVGQTRDETDEQVRDETIGQTRDETIEQTSGETVRRIDDKPITSTQTLDSTEEREPDSPRVTEQSPLPSLPAVSEDSKEVISEETPAEEVIPTTTLIGLRGNNGIRGGVKGGISSNGKGRKNGYESGPKSNGKNTGLSGITLNGSGNGKRVNGNGVKQNGKGVKPTTGSFRNGVTKPVNGKNGKKNGDGAQVIPASPATSGRKAQKPKVRTNGDGQQRTSGGTKSIYRPTVQRAELDEESSNVYYRGR